MNNGWGRGRGKAGQPMGPRAAEHGVDMGNNINDSGEAQ